MEAHAHGRHGCEGRGQTDGDNLRGRGDSGARRDGERAQLRDQEGGGLPHDLGPCRKSLYVCREEPRNRRSCTAELAFAP